MRGRTETHSHVRTDRPVVSSDATKRLMEGGPPFPPPHGRCWDGGRSGPRLPALASALASRRVKPTRITDLAASVTPQTWGEPRT